jgi:hypothetical protein
LEPRTRHGYFVTFFISSCKGFTRSINPLCNEYSSLWRLAADTWSRKYTLLNVHIHVCVFRYHSYKIILALLFQMD